MRKIPIKNYVLSIIISLITIVLVFYIMDRYNNRYTDINFLNEIKEVDLDYYIAENNNVLIYMTSSKNSKEIEKQFKKYIKNKDIKEHIIYVNLNNVSSVFKERFIKKYSSSELVINDPTLILMENKKVKNWLTNIENFEQIRFFIEGSNIR